MKFIKNFISILKKNWLLVFILLSVFLLGIYRINHLIWWDEMLSLYIAFQPLSSIWSLKIHPNGFYFNKLPPFYETVLHFLLVFSEENYVLIGRLFSIFLTIVSLILIFYIAKFLFDRKVGIIATFLAAFNYTYLYHCRWIKYTPLLNVLTLFSFYLFLKMVKEKRVFICYSLPLVCINTLILYTFYFGIFVIWVEFVLAIFILRAKKDLLKVFIWLCCPLLLFIPWLKHFIYDCFKETALTSFLDNTFSWNNFFKFFYLRLSKGIFYNPILFFLYSFILIWALGYGIKKIIQKEENGQWVISLCTVLLLPIVSINLLTLAEYLKGDCIRARYFFNYIFSIFILGGVFFRKVNFLKIFLFSIICILSVHSAYKYLVSSSLSGYPDLEKLVDISLQIKNFPVSQKEKVVIHIEDPLLIPTFVYYFYGPRYMRLVCVPHLANKKGMDILSELKPNYKIYFDVAGIKKYHLFKSIPEFVNADYLILIYSTFFAHYFGGEWRFLYEKKLQEYNLLDRITLLKKDAGNNFILEIYKVNKPNQ